MNTLPQRFPLRLQLKAAAIALCVLAWFAIDAGAAPLRRPVSPACPMYLMQVNPGVGEDPQGAINAIPPDIKPWVVVMQCQPAQSGNNTNGFAQAQQFLSTCYSNGVWAMVQVASGGYCTMDNLYTNDYETLYQRYPNLIGFAFAEQDWGFGSTTSEYGQSTLNDRLELFAKLLALGDIYGGYLYDSEMQSVSNSGSDPVAKLKLNLNFRNATVTYITNFIIGSKFTMSRGFYDNESACLGFCLSGHAGNYAVRYDQYSWGYTGRSRVFGTEVPPGTSQYGALDWFSCPEPAMGIPIVDHVMLSGASVVDGPENAWDTTLYQGHLTPVFNNMIADIFRKILDKTIPIPDVNTVRSNCPIAFVSNQSNNTTASLYDGLYRVNGDGTLGTNLTWFKNSGQYFTIPEVYTNAAYEISFFTTNVLQSQYSNRWPTVQDKVNEFNSYCPPVSTGDAFVARRENRLFTYDMWINSNIDNSASIPLEYNTCSTLDLTYSAHTFGVIVEHTNSIQIYLNNYRTDKYPLYAQYPGGMSQSQVSDYIATNFIPYPWLSDDTANTIRTNTIQVTGCTSQPTYAFADRGDHPASTVSSSYSGGVFTLTIVGNGPSDITINSSGNGTGRLAEPQSWTITQPPVPPVSDPPSPPSALSATAASSSEIDLSWAAGPGATSYNVKRSNVSGGPYTTIASGVLLTGYADTTVAANMTYYYVVSSVNSLGESANSSEATGSTGTVVTNVMFPMADSYVNDGGSANNNYGTATNMVVKSDATPGDGLNRNSYIKFDVHALTNFLGARVILTCCFQDNSGTTLNYWWATNNTWTETGITWNNQPGNSGTGLATISGYSVGTSISFDVSAAARAQVAKDGYLSIEVTEPSAASHRVDFATKENSNIAWRPVLQYTTTSNSAPAAPASPTGLSAAGGNLVVNLNWAQSTSSGITGNNVYRSTSGSGGPYNLLANLVASTSYSDTAVSTGSTYYYSVTAVNSSGESALSAYAGATTVPAAPAGLSATAGNNQVALSWSAASGAGSYNVKRATTNGGPYTTLGNVSSTTFTDTTAVNGTTYYYVVSAVNNAGESADSTQVSATPSAPVAPNAPTGLSASAGRKKVTLTWTESTSGNITNNKVYRATVNGGPYTLVTTIAANTTYTDSGLSTGRTYYYVVTAINSSGLESAYSNQASATPK